MGAIILHRLRRAVCFRRTLVADKDADNPAKKKPSDRQ